LLGVALGLTLALIEYKNLALYMDRQWHWGGAISAFILQYFPQSVGALLDSIAPLANLTGSGALAGSEQLPESLAGSYTTLAAQGIAGTILELLAFIILVLVVYLVAKIAMRLLTGAATVLMLGPLNRLAGLLFGLLRGGLVVVIVAALLNPVYSASTLTGETRQNFLGSAVTSSVLLPYARSAAATVRLQLPGLPLDKINPLYLGI